MINKSIIIFQSYRLRVDLKVPLRFAYQTFFKFKFELLFKEKMNGVSLWLMTLVVLMDYGMSHVEKKVDLEAMTGDEIAAMAIESRKSNPQESFGSTLSMIIY